jgi:hypothetical protein
MGEAQISCMSAVSAAIEFGRRFNYEHRGASSPRCDSGAKRRITSTDD